MAQAHSTNCPCQRVRAAFGQHAFHSKPSRHTRQHLSRTAPRKGRSHSAQTNLTTCTAAQPGLDSGASSPPKEKQSVKPISSEGRDTYHPQSFQEITEDAVKAVLAAIEQGHHQLEVEFPTIPASQSKLMLCAAPCLKYSDMHDSAIGVLPGTSRTSDDYIDANVQLGLSAAGMVSYVQSSGATASMLI